MTNLIAGIVGVLVASNQPVALSNLVAQTAVSTAGVSSTNDPVEMEYQNVLSEDDKAMAEVDGWIRENNEYKEKGAGVDAGLLNDRIKKRLDTVDAGYQDFIKRHPDHARIHVAYGSFLDNRGREEPAVDEYEKAIKIDPKLPSAYNQAANYYAHRSPVKKAFEYYEKAITLDPGEEVYYHNLADVVFLFRPDAEEYYKISEPQVFDKALALYRKAREIEPENFKLSTDLAESYYGIKPFRTNEAIEAWSNSLALASSDVEREGVLIHLARINIMADRTADARALLGQVTNADYADLKARLLRNAEKKEHPEPDANAPPQTPRGTNSNTIEKTPSPSSN